MLNAFVQVQSDSMIIVLFACTAQTSPVLVSTRMLRLNARLKAKHSKYPHQVPAFFMPARYSSKSPSQLCVAPCGKT